MLFMMADEIMYTILLNMLETLPKFSGNRGEDVIQWLDDVTNGFEYAQFTDDQKLSIISTYIEGDARRWLIKNMSILDSWSTFIHGMKKMFAPSLLKEVAVSQVNQCVKALEEIMIDDENEIIEEQKYELLKEEKEYPDFSTTPVEVDNIVSSNACMMESDEDNFKNVWPDGGESWFIHDELPQRLQFINCKQQEISFSSTPNIEDDFGGEKLPGDIDVVLSSIIIDKNIYSSYDFQEFYSLLKLDNFHTDVIRLLLLLGSLAHIVNTCSQFFTVGTTTPYFCHKVISWDTEDRDWFRTLAVP
jgi:hypothetical protein